MLLRSNNTLGDIQSGFMKLIPIYTLKRVKTSSIRNESTKEEQLVERRTSQRDRSRSIELEVDPVDKSRSKRKSRNNSVKVVNRSQAKTMSSLQALRATSLPKSNRNLSPSFVKGARHHSGTSNDSDSSSPCRDHEILPYTLMVDVSEFQKKLYIHTPKHHSLVNTRKVRFD